MCWTLPGLMMCTMLFTGVCVSLLAFLLFLVLPDCVFSCVHFLFYTPHRFSRAAVWEVCTSTHFAHSNTTLLVTMLVFLSVDSSLIVLLVILSSFMPFIQSYLALNVNG